MHMLVEHNTTTKALMIHVPKAPNKIYIYIDFFCNSDDKQVQNYFSTFSRPNRLLTHVVQLEVDVVDGTLLQVQLES